jgi:hypothetical protein
MQFKNRMENTSKMWQTYLTLKEKAFLCKFVFRQAGIIIILTGMSTENTKVCVTTLLSEHWLYFWSQHQYVYVSWERQWQHADLYSQLMAQPCRALLSFTVHPSPYISTEQESTGSMLLKSYMLRKALLHSVSAHITIGVWYLTMMTVPAWSFMSSVLMHSWWYPYTHHIQCLTNSQFKLAISVTKVRKNVHLYSESNI